MYFPKNRNIFHNHQFLAVDGRAMRAPTKGAVNSDLSTSVTYNTVGNGLCAVPGTIPIHTVGNGLCAVPGTIPFYAGENIGNIGNFTAHFF